MSIKKSKKTDRQNVLEESQDEAPAYITVHDVLQLCAFWGKNDSDIGTILAMDHPEDNIKIVKKSEKAVLEIKFTNALQEEKIIQIEIKIYD